MVVEKISEKVLETLNNGEKGNIHNIAPPSLDYIADRIRHHASEYSSSTYTGRGVIILSVNRVEKCG